MKRIIQKDKEGFKQIHVYRKNKYTIFCGNCPNANVLYKKCTRFKKWWKCSNFLGTETFCCLECHCLSGRYLLDRLIEKELEFLTNVQNMKDIENYNTRLQFVGRLEKARYNTSYLVKRFSRAFSEN